MLRQQKIQAFIDQQRTNLADVEYLDLDYVEKVVKIYLIFARSALRLAYASRLRLRCSAAYFFTVGSDR